MAKFCPNCHKSTALIGDGNDDPCHCGYPPYMDVTLQDVCIALRHQLRVVAVLVTNQEHREHIERALHMADALLP